MNIVYITSEKIITGASLSLMGMIRHLQEKHNIYVIVPGDCEEYVKRLQEFNVEVIEWPYSKCIREKTNTGILWEARRLSGRVKCFGDRIQAYKLAKILKEKEIDIVHSNLRTTVFGAWLAYYLKVSHIWHIREYGEEDFNLYPVYSQRWMYSFMYNNAKCLIAISDGIYLKFREIFSDKIIKISNGIEIEQFLVENRKILEDERVAIAMISNVAPTKGQYELLEAINNLRADLKSNLKIKIAGGCYNSEYKNKLDEYITSNNMETIVEFVGFLDDTKALLAKSDILVMASRMEGFGRVTVEGMLAGCLIVGANTGGTVEIVDNGKYGVLYEQGNYLDLSKKIEGVLENREKYVHMAEQGQLHAIKNYSAKRNAEEIEKVYLEIMKKAGKR